ncbi:unnamed protein product, partial [Phaeothamnion confervicola]
EKPGQAPAIGAAPPVWDGLPLSGGGPADYEPPRTADLTPDVLSKAKVFEDEIVAALAVDARNGGSAFGGNLDLIEALGICGDGAGSIEIETSWSSAGSVSPSAASAVSPSAASAVSPSPTPKPASAGPMEASAGGGGDSGGTQPSLLGRQQPKSPQRGRQKAGSASAMLPQAELPWEVADPGVSPAISSGSFREGHSPGSLQFAAADSASGSQCSNKATAEAAREAVARWDSTELPPLTPATADERKPGERDGGSLDELSGGERYAADLWMDDSVESAPKSARAPIRSGGGSSIGSRTGGGPVSESGSGHANANAASDFEEALAAAALARRHRKAPWDDDEDGGGRASGGDGSSVFSSAGLAAAVKRVTATRTTGEHALAPMSNRGSAGGKGAPSAQPLPAPSIAAAAAAPTATRSAAATPATPAAAAAAAVAADSSYLHFSRPLDVLIRPGDRPLQVALRDNEALTLVAARGSGVLSITLQEEGGRGRPVDGAIVFDSAARFGASAELNHHFPPIRGFAYVFRVRP